MIDNFLSNKKVMEILKNNDYVIFRFPSGSTVAYNCKIINNSKIKKSFEQTKEGRSNFVSYKSCGFQEYLTEKKAFLSS